MPPEPEGHPEELVTIKRSDLEKILALLQKLEAADQGSSRRAS